MPVSVSIMGEVQRPPESLYRKVITPGLDIVNHANKLGIRLKSKSALRLPVRPLLSTDRDTCTPVHGRASSRSSPHKFATQSQPTQFIHNVVVPLPLASSDLQQSLYRSLTATPTSYHSSKVRNNSLPIVPRGTRTSTAKTNSSVKSMGTSLYTDKYLSTTPSEKLLLEGGEDVSTWNTSSQALRFEAEKLNISKSKTMKRLSEIQSHRVDRMYYLEACTAPIHAKYHVDQEELRRLKELSRARRTTPHYGRGLSHSSGTEEPGHDQQTPRPTPAANTPQPNTAQMQDENEAGEKQQETFITQETNPANQTEKAKQDKKAASDIDSLGTVPAESEQDDTAVKATARTTENGDADKQSSEVEEWARVNKTTPDGATMQAEPQDQVNEEEAAQNHSDDDVNSAAKTDSNLLERTESNHANEEPSAVQDSHVTSEQTEHSGENAKSS